MESSTSIVGSGQYLCQDPMRRPDEGGVGLPEIYLNIFSRLSPTNLGSCLSVNKKWSQLASDELLWKDFKELVGVEAPVDVDVPTVKVSVPPRLKVIDDHFWKKHVDLAKHGLCVNEPLFDRTVEIAKLKKGLTLAVEEEKGIAYLTIPQGLSIKKAIQIAKENKIEIYFTKEILEKFGDIEVNKTYTIVITRNILEKSRNIKSFVHLRELVEVTHGCEKQKTIETMALIILTFMISGERLYADCYTYQEEQIEILEENGPMIVGGFSSSDFRVFVSLCFDCGITGVGVAL